MVVLMRKSLKIVLGILILLIILWGIIFLIDYSKCASFKMPIFVVAGESIDNGDSDTYYGLGYKVEVEVEKNISADGYSDFEISIVKSENKESKRVLNNQELYKHNSDYDLYYYGVDEINVTVDNKTMPLEDALRSGKVTIEKIISNANRDLDEGRITGDMYKEGGTMEYHYDTYAIIKSHSLDGNRDVYIGVPEMRLTEVR